MDPKTSKSKRRLYFLLAGLAAAAAVVIWLFAAYGATGLLPLGQSQSFQSGNIPLGVTINGKMGGYAYFQFSGTIANNQATVNQATLTGIDSAAAAYLFMEQLVYGGTKANPLDNATSTPEDRGKLMQSIAESAKTGFGGHASSASFSPNLSINANNDGSRLAT